MPLVFVHGVATRRDPGYERGVAARNALFRRYVHPVLGVPADVAPCNAYWGGDAAAFRWDHASLPASDVEAFGIAEEPEDHLLADALASRRGDAADDDADAPVSAVARTSVDDAVDLVWASAGMAAADDEEAAWLAALAHRVTDLLPVLRADPALARPTDDAEWLTALADRVEAAEAANAGPPASPATEAFGTAGAWDRLSESLIRLRGAAGRVTGSVAVALVRARLHRQAAVFIGDVLTYVNQRGTRDEPGAIVTAVVDAIDSAVRERGTRPGEPLVVVAHSMGGNIAYDVLSYYRPDIRVNAFVTVGSQVGLFEELCLLQAGIQANCPRLDRVAALPNVGRWLNVYDVNDVLGYSAWRIFAGVADYEYSTGKGVLAAHSSYFTMPSFFRRLAERVQVRT